HQHQGGRQLRHRWRGIEPFQESDRPASLPSGQKSKESHEYQAEGEEQDRGAERGRVVRGDVVHASTVSRGDKTDVRCQAASGKVTVKVAPGPSLLRAVSEPWCCSTIQRAIESPSPAPLFERAGFAW